MKINYFAVYKDFINTVKTHCLYTPISTSTIDEIKNIIKEKWGDKSDEVSFEILNDKLTFLLF